MNGLHVLVVGGSGFIGRHLVALLLNRGHAVTVAARRPRPVPGCRSMTVDLARDHAAAWVPRLRGVDAVVNAAGVLRGDLDGVQRRGAMALLDACAEARVSRVVQISAVGAGTQATAFLRTKAAADAHLASLAQAGGRAWCVLRPSLVVGRGGASTALFAALAALPRPLGLAAGRWTLQPVHVDDVARAVADLLSLPGLPAMVELVGPEPMTTDALTTVLRAWLGLRPRPLIHVPAWLLHAGAGLGDFVPGARLSRDSLAMLAAGNTADPGPASNVLGWSTRPIEAALRAHPAAQGDRAAARLLPLQPVLVARLAAVWIGTGLVSMLLDPSRADTLLNTLGLAGWGAIGATWLGAALDLVLGLGLLRPGLRRSVLRIQLAVMAVYTVLATIAVPGLWLDPFGPLLKNLGVLAASLALLAMEEP